jgi:formate hydrogenlyase subunit 3/multisubunit Na+/H+ antiporter MnhD subunit
VSYFGLLGTIIGAMAMIGYPLLIGFTASLRHILSLVPLAGILAFTVCFSLELDRPFHGLFRVDPDAFRAALIEFTRIP